MTSGISVLILSGRGGRALLMSADSIARQRAMRSDLLLVTHPDHPNAPLVGSVAARLHASVVVAEPRPGIALNRAVRSALGDQLAFVPAGFVIPETFLERCALAFRADEALSALAPGVEVQTADGLGRAVWRPDAMNPAAVLADPAGVPPVFVVRRSAVDAVGGFDEHLRALAEYEFWLRLTLSGRHVAPLREPLVRREIGLRTTPQYVSDDEYLGHLRDVLAKHESALGDHMQDVLVTRELRFGRSRERHRDLLARRDSELAELDHLRATAAHHRAYLEHHGRAGLDWGDLRRTDPVSRDWGYDRGTPVDRRHIEAFLAAHSSDVRGAVLEVQEDDFTRAFGGSRVTSHDVVDIDPSSGRATILADLRCAPDLSSDRFDCIVLTQTLHVIDDVGAALRECHRILKPGGVLLATLPAASRSCLEYGTDGDLWRVTPAGARRLVEAAFEPSHASYDVYGNILTNTAFLHGLAAEELTDAEFETADPYFPAITGVRARKSEGPERVAPRGLVLLYHRLDDTADVHDLSIPSGLFEAQLQWLRTNCTLMQLDELLSTSPADAWPERPVAITFDDGYLDNLTVAAPLLSMYGVPATFFVTSRWLDAPGEYWWDTLERILWTSVLGSGGFQIDIAGEPTDFSAATTEARDAAHVRLHDALVHAPLAERDRIMDALRAWAGTGAPVRAERRPMLADELRQLARIPGMDIGGHTVNHVALPDQPRDVQEREVTECRTALALLTGRPIELFAYPYGAVDRHGAGHIRRSHRWGLSCDARQLGDSFDAARVPRLEVKRLEPAALSDAVEWMFRGIDRERLPRISRLPD